MRVLPFVKKTFPPMHHTDMGRVLPFQRKGAMDPIAPVACGDGMSTNPMRRIVYRKCNNIFCYHEWSQPSPTGNCPKCRCPSITNTGEGRCAAPYRK